MRRRTNAAGVFLDETSVICLVGAILQEQDEEWDGAKRYFSLESMRRLYAPPPLVIAEPVPFTLAPVHCTQGCGYEDVAPLHPYIHNHYDDEICQHQVE